MYSQYERPPFPILVSVPTIGDILGNYQFSDFVLWMTFYGVGYGLCFSVARKTSSTLLFSSVTHLFGLSGLSVSMLMSYNRLVGLWDNGLRWNVPNDTIEKFDCTSRYEDNTIFWRMRVRTDR